MLRMKKRETTVTPSRGRRNNRLHVAWLAFACVGILVAAGWMSSQPAPTSPAGGMATAEWRFIGGVLLWEPLFGRKVQLHRKTCPLHERRHCPGRVGVCLDARRAGQKCPAGHQEDAGDRPGHPRRGQRLSFPAVQRGRRVDRVDYRPAVFRRPGVETARAFCYGRAAAFFVGSLFSATVGFVGMRLATVGNLRVAAAAKTSFGQALQLGYRTGTITGMLTDGWACWAARSSS